MPPAAVRVQKFLASCVRVMYNRKALKEGARLQFSPPGGNGTERVSSPRFTESEPSAAGPIWRGRRKERMCSFRRQAETERSEFLLTTPGCSAAGSARGLGPRCRRFESCHSDQRRRSFRTAVKRRSLWRSPFSRLCSMSPPFRIEAPRGTSLAASRQFTSPASLGFDSVLL